MKTTKRFNYWEVSFLVGLIIFCLSSILYFFNWEFGHDSHVFIYMAKHFEKLGLLSYRDILEQNYIGAHLAYFGIGKIFGFTSAGLKVCDIILMTALVGISFIVLKGYRTLIRLTIPFIFIALYLASWPKHNMQREYLCLIPLAFCFLLSTKNLQFKISENIKLLAIGMLVGISATIKPTMTLFIPIVLWGYYANNEIDFNKRLFAAFFLAPLSLILLPVALSVAINFSDINILSVGTKIFYSVHGFFTLFTIALVILLFRFKESSHRSMAIFFIAANTPLLLSTLHLYLAGVLEYFIKLQVESWPFYFKLDVTLNDTMTPLKKIRIGLEQFLGFGDYWPMAFPVLFGAYLTYQKKSENYKLMLAYTAGSLTIVLVAFKFFPYHFYPLFFFGCFALIPIIDKQDDLVSQATKKTLQVLTYGGIALSLFLIQGQGSIYAKKYQKNLAEAVSVIKQERLKHPDRKLKVQPLGWVQMGAIKVMDMNDLLLPSKYLYTIELFHHVEHSIIQRRQGEFMDTMKSIKPDYFIEEPAESYIYHRSSPQQLFPALDLYKRANYKLIYPKLEERTKLSIWKRKDLIDN